jgi:hypothetical protein
VAQPWKKESASSSAQGFCGALLHNQQLI